MAVEMKRIVHLLTLMSMLAMFWVSTPSQTTACIPATTVNECCAAGKCDAAMICVCCRTAESSSTLSSNDLTTGHKLALQVTPRQAASFQSDRFTDRRERPASAARHAGYLVCQPIKLYLLNRSLLI